MVRLATSLPGGNPPGMVLTTPSGPFCARKSRFGVLAVSTGVLPPSFFYGVIRHSIRNNDAVFHDASYFKIHPHPCPPIEEEDMYEFNKNISPPLVGGVRGGGAKPLPILPRVEILYGLLSHLTV